MNNVSTNTFFVLMAEFGSVTIELEKICDRYFGMCPKKADQEAARNRLPVPTFRAGSQKSPRLVHLRDLAEHIDKCRQAAADEWRKSQTA